MAELLLGLDIGGTKCTVIHGKTGDGGLDIIDRFTFPTETHLGLEHSLGTIFSHIDLMIGKHGLSSGKVKALGVSCGGPLDSKTGIVMSPPNLPGWDNVPLVKLLTDRYGIKSGIQNDANACALAEWKSGAGRGSENMIFMTFGTGLGAGLILNGRLYSGTNDMAGEIGHIRMCSAGPVGYGKAGSWEGFCSGSGIAQLARTMVMEKWQMGERVSFCKTRDDFDNLNAQIVAEAAIRGDETALGVYRTSGEYLGRGLSILIDILNPEVIVIGSIFARSGKLLEPHTLRIIEAEALALSRNVCRIVPAQLGEDLGDYAALSVAANLL
ncbi:MAG TPA: ROK family protein [Bacteroidales bacterium]|jgi:glucokinase|nr:ROK family protein [Bacteroidales bacterium]HOS71617.1 ROK family protein [Bacteroidales bacterium]HQH24488.1 ROK family protein [Bacteroidales bacterium]HQJ82562.1 ROK family protein [Bacteroidales bacterium]